MIKVYRSTYTFYNEKKKIRVEKLKEKYPEVRSDFYLYAYNKTFI